MNKAEIKIKYLEKIKSIQKHNQLYYNENKNSISDQKYDKIKRENNRFRKKIQFFK